MVIVGYFNFHIDCPTDSNTVHIMEMLQTFRFSQAVSVPTHRCGHTLDLVVHREDLFFVQCQFAIVCLLIICLMDILKPESRPVLRTTPNLRAIYGEQFREHTASLATVQPNITADQFTDAPSS